MFKDTEDKEPSCRICPDEVWCTQTPSILTSEEERLYNITFTVTLASLPAGRASNIRCQINSLVCPTSFRFWYLTTQQTLLIKRLFHKLYDICAYSFREMDDAPFITLAAGGMQPEASPSPVNPCLSHNSVGIMSIPVHINFGWLCIKSHSSPPSSISMATHDISRTKYHIAELATFAARLENVSQKLLPIIQELYTNF